MMFPPSFPSFPPFCLNLFCQKIKIQPLAIKQIAINANQNENFEAVLPGSRYQPPLDVIPGSQPWHLVLGSNRWTWPASTLRSGAAGSSGPGCADVREPPIIATEKEDTHQKNEEITRENRNIADVSWEDNYGLSLRSSAPWLAGSIWISGFQWRI